MSLQKFTVDANHVAIYDMESSVAQGKMSDFNGVIVNTLTGMVTSRLTRTTRTALLTDNPYLRSIKNEARFGTEERLQEKFTAYYKDGVILYAMPDNAFTQPIELAKNEYAIPLSLREALGKMTSRDEMVSLLESMGESKLKALNPGERTYHPAPFREF